jgi:putative flippase GtrA
MRSLFIIDKLFIYKFIKFGAVGCSGMIIDFGITYLCKEIFKLNKYISNGIGFILAATSNYFLNRIWTFESCKEDIGIQ